MTKMRRWRRRQLTPRQRRMLDCLLPVLVALVATWFLVVLGLILWSALLRP